MSLHRFATEVASVSPEDTVQQAAVTMRERGVGCLVVTEGRRLVGIVTDRDLVARAVAEGVDPSTARVGRFTTYDPITICVNDGIETAAERMRLHGIRRLPIIDQDRNLVGIVTSDDLLVMLGGELAGVCGTLENASDSIDSR
jgi:CBS domain-containing protein